MGIETAVLLSYAALAGTAVATVGTLYSADTQKNTAEANAEMSRRQGNQEKDAAIAQAEKIRKAGRAAAGRATAATAAAGVAIGDGTPLRINEEITLDSERDAYSTLLTGTRRQQSANDQAGMMIADGKAGVTAGYLNAGSTILQGAANYGKWKTSQKKGS